MTQHAIRTGDGQVVITERLDAHWLIYVHEDGPRGGVAAEVALNDQQRQALVDAMAGAVAPATIPIAEVIEAVDAIIASAGRSGGEVFAALHDWRDQLAKEAG